VSIGNIKGSEEDELNEQSTSEDFSGVQSGREFTAEYKVQDKITVGSRLVPCGFLLGRIS